MKSRGTIYNSRLDLGEVRRLISRVATKASVNDMTFTSLDEKPDIGVLIEQKVSFFGGIGAVQVIVTNRGSHREIELVALGTGISEGVAAGFAQDVSGLRQIGASQKLVARLIDALLAADTSLSKIG